MNEIIKPRNLKPTTLFFTFLGISIFVITRLQYWAVTYEFPFSDMADFEKVAQNILNNFSFKYTEFWATYKPPILPGMRALQVYFTGENFLYWRIFLLIFTLIGLLWLAREIFIATNNSKLALLFIFFIAISKSSIFWSYKLATEGLAEGYFYYSLAAAFFAWRRPERGMFPLGIILTIATLNRPNYILSLGIFPLLFVFKEYYGKQGFNFKRCLKLAFLYGSAIFMIWAPWVYRSYTIYGKPLPLNTSGPLGFIYGVWQVQIEEPDGRKVTKNWEEIMALAPQRFKIDYDFYVWANGVVRDWFKDNWRKFPGMLLERVPQSIKDRDVQLTKVSRFRLFPNRVNEILVDKDYYFIISGIAGLCLLPFVFNSSLILFPALSVHPWLISLFFQGNPRFLEPMIPILLFGNIAYLAVILKLFRINKLGAYFAKFNYLISPIFTCACLIAGIVYFKELFSLNQSAANVNWISLGNKSFEEFGKNMGNTTAVSWELGGDGSGYLEPDFSRVRSGKSSVRVVLSHGIKALYQDIMSNQDIADIDFEISAYIFADSPNSAYLAVSDGEKWFFSERNKSSGAWEKLQVKGRVSDYPTSFRAHIYLDNGSVSIDDFEISASQ